LRRQKNFGFAISPLSLSASGGPYSRAATRITVRFDDSLKTVLAGDIDSGSGAEAAWRQMVDLIGRGRVAEDEPAIARLRLLRQAVPLAVRAASGRALAFASPGPALVALFAEDVLAVAAPVLRTASLPASDWLALLSRLGPSGRSVLRHRRDLPDAVMRGLASFGATDFVLHDDRAVPANDVAPTAAAPVVLPDPPADTPRSDTPFVALGDVALGLPVVAEALRRVDAPPPAANHDRFEISELVARIDAFNRSKTEAPADPVAAQQPPASFRYETDADGAIAWVDGVARAPLVGVSFAYAAPQGLARVDAVMSGALRQRAQFADARLDIGGTTDAAGSWRVAGVPMFDRQSGRFTGYRGVARRPRIDEQAEPADRKAASDALRQLVHELRTPTNAIAGFAELIEAQLLGPVAANYREHAIVIRESAASLLAAIDDLDTAARIDGRALDLRPTQVALAPLLARIAADLQPLATLRRAALSIGAFGDGAVTADDRAVERLISRLVAALLSAAAPGECIGVQPIAPTPGYVVIALDRPVALGTDSGEALLSIDADAELDGEGAPLLGIGFSLRLARNLANELGGTLSFGARRLTLRLPVALDQRVGQAGI